MNKEKLKEFCKSIGVNCVGIAGIGPYNEVERIIKRRIENGHITGMEEPIIENRVNSKNTMENVKSIIVCAFPYYAGEFEKSNLSKYCYGEDYHTIVKTFLLKICKYLEKEIIGFEYKYFVDNGPLVDRYLAYISGLGYFGINNNIITDEYGSYVFIGYIMTNYEFKVDEPLPKTCIKCGKCVKYCPGNALLGNYEMNPKRCVSYITQKKGELNKEEIDILTSQEKIFGCDICQEVCPHNNGVQTTNILQFKESLMLNITKEDIETLSNKEFKRIYGNRAFSWRGKNIIKRNIDINNNKYKP